MPFFVALFVIVRARRYLFYVALYLVPPVTAFNAVQIFFGFEAAPTINE